MTTRKLLPGLLVAAIALTFFTSCASLPKAKIVVYTTTSTTRTVIGTAQAVEVNLVCGRPQAPASPACLSLELHRKIEGYILEAADYDSQIAAIMRDVPEGAPTPADVINLGAKVLALVQKIIDELPQRQADTLRARAEAQNDDVPPPRTITRAEWDALIADLQRIMELARREIAATS